ncbi:MAG: hypothetical protein AAGG45_06260, partial [Pseudomonadota bacterium]
MEICTGMGFCEGWYLFWVWFEVFDEALSVVFLIPALSGSRRSGDKRVEFFDEALSASRTPRKAGSGLASPAHEPSSGLW